MTKTRKVSKQKKRNSWYLVYRPPGQSKPVWEPAGCDEQVAEQRRLEKMAELADSDYEEPSRECFASVVEEWWKYVAVDKYAESTRHDYRSIIDRHLIPAFGALPISRIKYRQVQKFASAKQAEGLSGKRVRNMLVVLSVIFTYARKADFCRENPVDDVDRPPIRRKEIDCLDPQELWQLLAAVKEVRPFYFPLVLTALMTGMRLSELRALTWNHVDFENGEILVRSSRSRSELKGPKTNAGWRTVPMSSLVREALTEQADGRIAGCDLVFPSNRLTPFDPANVRNRVLYKALDHAKLRRVTWHSLRHSAASIMALAGASEKEVQMILGHSSIQVTKDLYTHLFHGAKVEAIDRMTELMLSTKPDEVEEVRSIYHAICESKAVASESPKAVA